MYTLSVFNTKEFNARLVPSGSLYYPLGNNYLGVQRTAANCGCVNLGVTYHLGIWTEIVVCTSAQWKPHSLTSAMEGNPALPND